MPFNIIRGSQEERLTYLKHERSKEGNKWRSTLLEDHKKKENILVPPDLGRYGARHSSIAEEEEEARFLLSFDRSIFCLFFDCLGLKRETTTYYINININININIT